MSVAFGLIASVALASVPANEAQDLDDASMHFANTLVTAYSCDFLGYGVDYLGLADRGHEVREAIMDGGATYDEAMEQIQSKISNVRGRFNGRYRTAFVFGGAAQGRYQKTFTDKCDELADNEETAEFFSKSERRLSYAEFRRKLRDRVVLARRED